MHRVTCRHSLALLLCFIALDDFIDAPSHVEVILTDMVNLPLENLLEATNGFLERNISTFASGEDLRNGKWLREESLHLASASNYQLVFIRKLIDTQDRNDVLQVFVPLQHFLHATGN